MEGSSSGVLGWHHICAPVAHSAMKEIYCIVSCANQGPGKEKNTRDWGHWSNHRERKAGLPWEPNTADVNNVIYWCHLEKIGPKGASFFASSLCYMWRDPLLCLFVQLSLGRRKGLHRQGSRGEPRQTVLLKLVFWYILNNNGFTRQEFFPLVSQPLHFPEIETRPTEKSANSSPLWVMREIKGSRPDQYLS